MVGKIRRRLCWRSSLRTAEVVLTEGGASSGGAGVLRPLRGRYQRMVFEGIVSLQLFLTWQVLRCQVRRHLEQTLSRRQRSQASSRVADGCRRHAAGQGSSRLPCRSTYWRCHSKWGKAISFSQLSEVPCRITDQQKMGRTR
jgi:hypothetical protein